MDLKMNPLVFKELRWPKQAVAGVHKCTDPLCPHPLTECPAISLQRLPQREKGSHFHHSLLLVISHEENVS